MKTLIGLIVALATPLALAHEGHGLTLPHWHATDTLGFVAARRGGGRCAVGQPAQVMR